MIVRVQTDAATWTRFSGQKRRTARMDTRHFQFNIPHLTLFAMGDLAPWLVAGFPPTRSSMPVLSLWTDIATRMPLQGKGPKIPFQLTTLGWNTLLSRKLKLSSGAWFLKGLKMSETQRRPLYRIPCKVDTNQIKLSTAARYRTCIPCSSLSLASVRLPKRASNLEPMTNKSGGQTLFSPSWPSLVLLLSNLLRCLVALLSSSTFRVWVKHLLTKPFLPAIVSQSMPKQVEGVVWISTIFFCWSGCLSEGSAFCYFIAAKPAFLENIMIRSAHQH